MLMTLYGLDTDDLEAASAWIERATGLVAEPGYSDHRGGDYYYFGADRPVTLQHNFEYLFEIAEPDFAEYPTICYVDEDASKRVIQAQLDAYPNVFKKLRENDTTGL